MIPYDYFYGENLGLKLQFIVKKKSVSIELFSHNQITKQKGATYFFDNFECSC